ncbi:MAG: DNA topoisomerase I, partial [Rickettsiales bacterium]
DYTPNDIKSDLDNDQFKLYDLIWKRCVASQVNNAIIDQVSIIISNEDDKIRAKAVGSSIEFDGFYKLYREGLDDVKDEEDKLLPKVSIGEYLEFKDLKLDQHFTEAPPRFSEASLIKKLEELGIGRPSTYASIISVIQDRNYVKLDKKRFHPEERGRLVTAFLVSFFKQYVEYDFTASLEEQLDQVSSGCMYWKDLLKNFWSKFYDYSVEIKNLDPLKVTEAITDLLHNHFFPDGNKNCPLCKEGNLSIKLGKWGVFAACSAYPDCKFTRTIGDENKEETDNVIENDIIGIDDSGMNIYLRKGPYGHYLQLGEIEGKKKPRRSQIPNFIEITDISIEKAKKLLSLPKNLGTNPDTIQEVILGIGRFGPYLLHDKKYT